MLHTQTHTHTHTHALPDTIFEGGSVMWYGVRILGVEMEPLCVCVFVCVCVCVFVCVCACPRVFSIKNPPILISCFSEKASPPSLRLLLLSPSFSSLFLSFLTLSPLLLSSLFLPSFPFLYTPFCSSLFCFHVKSVMWSFMWSHSSISQITSFLQVALQSVLYICYGYKTHNTCDKKMIAGDSDRQTEVHHQDRQTGNKCRADKTWTPEHLNSWTTCRNQLLTWVIKAKMLLS